MPLLGAAEVLPAVARRGHRPVPLLPRHLGHRRATRSSSTTRTRAAREAQAGSSTAALRYYKQTHADFYSDLFPRADFQNFDGARPGARRLPQLHHRRRAPRIEFDIAVRLAAARARSTSALDHLMVELQRFPQRPARRRSSAPATSRSTSSTRTSSSCSSRSGSDCPAAAERALKRRAAGPRANVRCPQRSE